MTDNRTRALLVDLAEYEPADEEEAESLGFITDFLKSEAEPFSRRTQRGHITSSAFVLDESYANVLMVWHRKLKRWLQPGGHVEDDDESTSASAMREAREETGFSVKPGVLGRRVFDVDVHRIPAYKGEPEHLHLDIRYIFIAAEKVGEADHEVRWQPLDEKIEGYDHSTIRALGKIAGMRA